MILEHHLAFANDCVSHIIYPLSLKTFVPSRADDLLKRKWKQILNNTSLELLALCRTHYSTLLEKTIEEIDQLGKQVKDSGDEEKICAWEEKRVGLEVEIKKRGKEVRCKKIKHAMKIHNKGRVFTENCLRERPRRQM